MPNLCGHTHALHTHIQPLPTCLPPPQVIHSILERAEAATKTLAEAPVPEPVTEQPAQIRATMREYQLQGLAWMVRCFDHGINAILADEMVRVLVPYLGR